MAPRFYRVTLAGKPMQFGGFGRVGTSWGSGKIKADTREQAIEVARVKCSESFSKEYAKGKATVVELHPFNVTVRHRNDKRKRSTFVVIAADETEALQYATYIPALTRVARLHGRDPDLVSVERA